MTDALPLDAFARMVHAAFGDGVAITRTHPLFGDASNRRYVRLTLTPASPPTAVVMILGEGRFAGGADELGGDAAPSELPFVDVGRYLTAHGFPVPRLYHDASRSDGMLLLEDIGDTTLWAAVERAPGDAERWFGAAVDLLVRLQVTGLTAPDPTCIAFRRRFDATLARAEIEHFIDHGIETRHGAGPLPADERRAILDGLALVERPFVDAAPTLCHRDFMAWNLHVHDGQLRLIDFQDAFLAPAAYDLAALLTDRHTPSIVSPDLEHALIDRFLGARARAGHSIAGDLATEYRLCALHRALKVIGRFHLLEMVKGKPGYLAYLPGVYTVGRRMFDALPALDAVRRRIVRWVPELA